MNKTKNILTIGFQIGMTFFLTVTIYMVFAFLDSDFGIDGIIGLVLFQPIIALIFSVITIIACMIIGLPLRLINKIKNWWRRNYFIPILGVFLGLTLLVLSLLPNFRELAVIELDGEERIKEIPNATLAIIGWILTAFMSLHIFPLEVIKNLVKKYSS